MLNKALDIAYKAHWGQTDKAGAPYKLHLTRVWHYIAKQKMKRLWHCYTMW